MAGLGIALFTDEMINPELARTLTRRGYDAISCREMGRANRKIDDEQQLEFAAAQGRAILTDNAVDFIACARRWDQAGREHAGIIICQQQPFSVLLRRVVHHLTTTDPKVQYNTVLFLAP